MIEKLIWMKNEMIITNLTDHGLFIKTIFIKKMTLLTRIYLFKERKLPNFHFMIFFVFLQNFHVHFIIFIFHVFLEAGYKVWVIFQVFNFALKKDHGVCQEWCFQVYLGQVNSLINWLSIRWVLTQTLNLEVFIIIILGNKCLKVEVVIWKKRFL